MKLYDITDIEKIFPDWHSRESELSYDDQKFIWEHTPLSEKDQAKLRQSSRNKIVSVNGSVNGTYKRTENYQKTNDKQELILKIRACNYLTPPKQVAIYLEQLFEGCGTKEGHCLYIAQSYTPKTISSILSETQKIELRGEMTIKNRAAYFTSIIKMRKKRKKFRNTNGGSKHKDFSLGSK